MMKSCRDYRALLLATILLCLATETAGQCMIPWTSPGSGWGSFDDLQKSLITIGSTLALLMMALQGMKWMMADSAEDREDAKRGIIYIIIGLIMLMSAYAFVFYLFCT